MAEDLVPSPSIILVFSGKRKSGKDYVTDKLLEEVGSADCEIMKVSAPLKKAYAEEHDLDFSKLLDSSDYKERVRVDMIAWGEERRNKDPGYFCRLTTLRSPGVGKPVWIISDARRRTDIQYFQETYPTATVTVRVTASLGIRESRGYVFTHNVDDAPSECDLDETSFDLVIENDGDDEKLLRGMDTLTNLIAKKREEASTNHDHS